MKCKVLAGRVLVVVVGIIVVVVTLERVWQGNKPEAWRAAAPLWCCQAGPRWRSAEWEGHLSGKWENLASAFQCCQQMFHSSCFCDIRKIWVLLYNIIYIFKMNKEIDATLDFAFEIEDKNVVPIFTINLNLLIKKINWELFTVNI